MSEKKRGNELWGSEPEAQGTPPGEPWQGGQVQTARGQVTQGSRSTGACQLARSLSAAPPSQCRRGPGYKDMAEGLIQITELPCTPVLSAKQ